MIADRAGTSGSYQALLMMARVCKPGWPAHRRRRRSDAARRLRALSVVERIVDNYRDLRRALPAAEPSWVR